MASGVCSRLVVKDVLGLVYYVPWNPNQNPIVQIAKGFRALFTAAKPRVPSLNVEWDMTLDLKEVAT